MMEYLNVDAIIVAGLMVGSELAIAAFVHPTLDRLPDNVHLPVASAYFERPVQHIGSRPPGSDSFSDSHPG